MNRVERAANPLSKVLYWAGHSSLLSTPRKIIWKLLNYTLASKHLTITTSNTEPMRIRDFELIKRVRLERGMLLLDNEAYQIMSSVRAVEKIAGDVAEVGVYRGGSARLICEVKGKRSLHLFDAFEDGLPDGAEELFRKGHYKSSLQNVTDYLHAYPQVHLYPGRFPNTAGPIKDYQFAFVHLDVDIYTSTMDSLRFFYPRMNRGGIILSHDYLWAVGVKQAFSEFFADKPEPVLELAGSQCGIVKL